jgi:AmiR/NasT family two-component response regulator
MDKDELRVIIADDEPITRMDLKELLTEEGYTVLSEVSDGFDAVENCKLYHPDLVLLDIKMPFLDGLSAAKIIYEEDLADTIIMLTAYSEREFIEQAKSYGVGGYLVKPIDEKSLVPNIELAVARSKEMKRLRKDMAKVTERLENRSIIEKAKGQIMAEQNITEQEAYDYIRKLSQAKNLSMRRVAEIILVKCGA